MRISKAHLLVGFSIGAGLFTGVPSWALQQLREDPAKAIGQRGVPGVLFIEEAHRKFDDCYQGETIVQKWNIVNPSDHPVKILKAFRVEDESPLEVEDSILNAGSSTTLTVRQEVDSSLGRSSYRYALITDEPGVSRYRFSLTGFVQSAYDPEAPQFQFGVQDQSAGGSLDLEVFSREVDRIEIKAVEGLPTYLKASWSDRIGIADEGVRIRLNLAPGAPLGINFGAFTLSTNVPHQPTLYARWAATLYGDHVPGTNPIDLGIVEVGSQGVAATTFVHRSGQAVKILSALSSNPEIQTEISDCQPASPGCSKLKLIARPFLRGPFKGSITVQFEGGEALPLNFQGIAATPGTQIRQIDLDSEPSP